MILVTVVRWVLDRWDGELDESIHPTADAVVRRFRSYREIAVWVAVVWALSFTQTFFVVFVWREPDPHMSWSLIWQPVLEGLAAALAEEVVFRGIAKQLCATRGLIYGSVLWWLFHQTNVNATILRLPTDLAWAVLLVKLWRDRNWKMAFGIHMAWNAIIITVENGLKAILVG